MPCQFIEDPGEFQDIINQPQPIIVYFFGESDGPGPEFDILMSDNHPAASQIQSFIVDVENTPVERSTNQLPLTVLYKEGKEVDFADSGDIDEFLGLCERAEYDG